MPLLEFWRSSPVVVGQLSIEQIVANAGNGTLKDASECSAELRTYLSQVPSEKIADYIDHCLSSSFTRSGMVFQDLVNELGRRLDYKVTNGRYHGTVNAIGFDGVWLSPEGHNTVLEVKTTDAYRISLDAIAGYRRKLIESNQVGSSSSILIVVGREDTGELEAQVRGSRHAWDIRLISADALIKLVQIKENTESSETGLKIRSLLAPMEYTRLDKMIDVVFTAAKDVETVISSSHEEADKLSDLEAPVNAGEQRATNRQSSETSIIQDKREQIIAKFAMQLGTSLIKKSRALFWDATHDERLVCTVSKRYIQKRAYPYWYAYHPQWHDFLKEGQKGFLVLGCIDLMFSFSIPVSDVEKILGALNATTKDDGRTYWHIHVVERSSNSYSVLLPKETATFDLSPYRVSL